MSSPHGFVNIRSGPGVEYDPPLGTYQNGVVADVLGKQYSSAGDLWWLISFPAGPFGRGWVYADYTDAQNIGQVPWVTAPLTLTPVTPSATPRPYAIINSPDGFLNVRSGPGGVYQPPLGRLANGTEVDILGKQLASDGALWWLVPFSGSWNGRGWIYASYTIARNTDDVPWIIAPPTPTLVPRTPTPTPTQPYVPPVVNWTITGRVVDVASGQPVGQASVQARLGNDGTTLSTLTDSNGNFSIVGQARDDGNLTLTVNAFGYEEYTKIAGAIKPRVYDFPDIELVRQQAPVVTWIVTGRVVEVGTYQPIVNADVKAVLGDDGVQANDLSDSNGQFSLDGQARDSGALSLTIVADGYQTFTTTYPPNDSRVYNLADLALVPLTNSCAYESVINLSETVALARLQGLNFTSVTTTSVTVGDDSTLIGRVINQTPSPPPEGESVRVNCQLPVVLGVGRQ
jgi:uncharacterized protein YraI